LVMSSGKNKPGKLVVISGPSGVGKGTICKQLVTRLENVFLSVSYTTRVQADGEENGRDYWFISREEFEKNIADDNMLEWAEVFGNYYGTPKDKIEQAREQGKTVLLEIDVQGGKQVKRIYEDAIMIFLLPPTQKELSERLNGRARDARETMEARLEMAGTEIASSWECYDNMVINEDLPHAVDEVVNIINSR